MCEAGKSVMFWNKYTQIQLYITIPCISLIEVQVLGLGMRNGNNIQHTCIIIEENASFFMARGKNILLDKVLKYEVEAKSFLYILQTN